MTQQFTVASQSAVVAAMATNWAMLSALMGGTSAMRAAGKALLPQFPKEDKDAYQARLSVSVLHPVFSRTVRVMAARPFVQDLKLQPDLPSDLSALAEDCDRDGTGLAEFFADRLVECLSHGLTGVLADYSGNGAKTKAEEKQAGARPYLCTYPCQSILGWRTKDHKLTMLRLMESVTEEDGEFGEQQVDQVRVLTPGAWRTYRKDAQGEWQLFDEGVTGIDFIAFTFFYGTKKGFGIGESPMLDLAFQNVEHWQSCSDQQNILHVARVPILFAKCFGEKGLTIGAGVAASSDSEDADLKWVEHTGAAIEAGQASIDALESRMRHAGAELLIRRAGPATATEVLSDNESNNSLLQNIVEEFEDGIEQCLRHCAAWSGNKSYAPEVELFKDFSVDPSGADMDTIFKAFEAEVLTAEQVRQEMGRRGLLATNQTEQVPGHA